MSSSFPWRRSARPVTGVGAGHGVGHGPRSPAAAGGADFAPVSRLAVLADDLAERPLGPSVAFRTALRDRLIEEAATRTPVIPAPRTEPTPEPRASSAGRRSGRRVARRVTAVGLLVVVSSGGITAAAAGAALPGDPLYGVKRLTESVTLHVEHGSSPTADVQFVSRRLVEAERIAASVAGSLGTASAPTGPADARWANFDRAVGDAAATLGQLRTDSPSPEVVTALADQRGRWTALLASVPRDRRASVQGVLDLVAAITGTVPSAADASTGGADSPGGAAPATPSGADPATTAPPPAQQDAAPLPSVPAAPSAASGSASDTGTQPDQRLPDLGLPSRRGDDAGNAPSTGSGAEQPRPRLPLLPGREDLPRRSNSSNSSAWDGGPGVLERTTEALNQLLPGLDDH